MAPNDEPPVRPTLRCVSEDLGLKYPPVTEQLHLISEPVVQRAQSVPARQREDGADRILCLRDRVWLKVKTGRDRGAVTEYVLETESKMLETFSWWLGAVGNREAGSDDDAYALLERRSAVTKRKSKSGIDSSWMLPGPLDTVRVKAELAAHEYDAMNSQVRALIAESTRTGATLVTFYGHHSLEVTVRVQDIVTYLAVGMTGVVDSREIAALLSCVPGVRAEDWGAEPGDVLGIKPHPGQVVYSTIIDPQSLDVVLEESPAGSLNISNKR